MEVFDAPARFYSAGTLPLDELAYWIAFSGINSIQSCETNLDTAFVPPLSIQLSQRSFHIPRS
jgi:hypothetical protein